MRPLAVSLALFALSCALAEAPPALYEEGNSTILECISTICPSGQYCIVQYVGGEESFYAEACFIESSFSYEICDFACPSDQDCRLGQCRSPDLEGKVCEFDPECDGLAICIQGHCTQVSCLPGETVPCYSGPPETLGVGECQQGYHLCTSEALFTEECIGERLPFEEIGIALCNGRDDDCDGSSDPMGIDALDLIFVFDISGSMDESIGAVREAIKLTAAMYNDPHARLGLVFIPNPIAVAWTDREFPWTAIPLLTYADFTTRIDFATLGIQSPSGNEASWDAVWLISENLQGLCPGDQMITLRPEAQTAIILFTDERGQTYVVDPPLDEATVCSSIRRNNVDFYTVIDFDVTYRVDSGTYPISEDFDDCGTIYPLTTDPVEMATSLEDIATSICQ